MSGSAISLGGGHFIGLRVGSCDFTPEHSKDSKNVSAKLVVSAYVNSRARNDNEGKRDIFTFTIWGKLAHTCAKSMSKGKEFHCETRPQTYMGRVFHNQQPVSMSDGTVLMTKKYSFTITRLVFGEESDKHVATEIQANLRPMGWNVPGSQEAAQWKEILKARMAVQFDPQAPTYGYARVRMPQGPGISAYIQDNQNASNGVAASFGPVNPAQTTVAPATQTAVNNGGFVVAGV